MKTTIVRTKDRRGAVTKESTAAQYEATRQAVVEALERAGVETMSMDDAARMMPTKPEWN